MIEPVHAVFDFWSMYQEVSTRRRKKGPFYPGWDLTYELLNEMMRRNQAKATHITSIQEQRQAMDSAVGFLPEVLRVKSRPGTVGGIAGRWFTPRFGFNESKGKGLTVLYLHGGGYVFYPSHHDNLISACTHAARSRVFVPDYRLAPEHPFPAQAEDALATYRGMLESGIDPQKIIVMGDSAGGNLAAVLLLKLRDLGEPLPRAAVLLCPWVDLTCRRPSLFENWEYDWVAGGNAAELANWYLQGHDPKDPLASPIFADLHGLPPLYIQAGTAEILRDQIVEFAEKAHRHGTPATLDLFPRMNHVFQAFGMLLHESRLAMRKIRKFIEEI